tara:strand:- start:366 stop:1436 length:1071 start_codon:yes stop_codon:yes gene_type:complete
MLKKFVKKIGKGIKKIGKAIGKPFKKLMKTKIGKIIGTIGMMMMGGWMMAGAKTFASTLWAGQGMGAAFTSGLSAMGTAANATFSTITEGITGMFTQNGTTTLEAGANSLKDEVVKNAGAEVQATATDIATKTAETASATTGVSPTDVTGQATATTTDGSIVTAGTETGGGRLLEETSRVGSMKQTPTSLLESTKPVEFGTDLAMESVSPDFALTDPTLPTVDPKQPGFMERNFPRVADILEESKTFTEAYDKTLGYAPLQNTNLPKFVRNTTIGEGMTVASLMASPEEPYIQGSSDVSGAISALQANDERLYAQMPMDQLMTQSSVPSPSLTTASSLLNKYKQAGYIYDTTLLAS